MDFHFIFETLYFFLPAGIANIMPVLVKNIPFLDKPLDFKGKIGDKRIFGNNKTWRGLFFGILGGVLVSIIQYFVGYDLSFFSYSGLESVLIVGLLMGAGAMFGDLIESFVKRGLNKNPGSSWFPFDQIDYILGGFLFLSMYLWLNWKILLVIFVEYFILHLLFNWIGYYLKLRKTKI